MKRLTEFCRARLRLSRFMEWFKCYRVTWRTWKAYMALSGTRAPVKRNISRALIAAITVASRINNVFRYQYVSTQILKSLYRKRVLSSVKII